jgi:hypothetical protein
MKIYDSNYLDVKFKRSVLSCYLIFGEVCSNDLACWFYVCMLTVVFIKNFQLILKLFIEPFIIH